MAGAPPLNVRLGEVGVKECGFWVSEDRLTPEYTGHAQGRGTAQGGLEQGFHATSKTEALSSRWSPGRPARQFVAKLGPNNS
jgi:hypothetical protein